MKIKPENILWTKPKLPPWGFATPEKLQCVRRPAPHSGRPANRLEDLLPKHRFWWVGMESRVEQRGCTRKLQSHPERC